jgi:hypothetical protein
MAVLTPSKSPNLQVPPETYSREQQNNLVNQLKLYHVQVDSNTQQLISQVKNSVVHRWLAIGP